MNLRTRTLTSSSLRFQSLLLGVLVNFHLPLRLATFPHAITNALIAFGYEEEEFEIETLDFGNGPDDDLGYQPLGR